MRLGDYEVVGPASARRTLQAAWLDWVAGAVLAILAFPFPLVRASVPTLGFVVSIVAALFAGAFLYLAVTARLLGRTPGMYLLDLGFECGVPTWRSAMLWALGWSVVAVPAVVAPGLGDGRSGAAARFSGVSTGSIASDSAGR